MGYLIFSGTNFLIAKVSNCSVVKIDIEKILIVSKVLKLFEAIFSPLKSFKIILLYCISENFISLKKLDFNAV